MRVRLALLSVAALLVAGCGSGSDGARPKPRPTTLTVGGYQFSMKLPVSWADVSARTGVKGLAPDIVYADRSVKGVKPIIAVGRDIDQTIRRTETAELAIKARRVLARQKGLRPGPITTLKLSGSNAAEFRTVGEQQGLRLERRDVLAKHRGTLYTIVYTTLAGRPNAERDFRKILATFRWTE